MDINKLKQSLEAIKGASYASVTMVEDIRNLSAKGKTEFPEAHRVYKLHINIGADYERFVMRMTGEAFVSGARSWGTHTDNKNITENRGKFYLACLKFKETTLHYECNGHILAPKDFFHALTPCGQRDFEKSCIVPSGGEYRELTLAKIIEINGI